VINFPLSLDGFHIDVEKTKGLIFSARPKMLIFGKNLFLFPEPVKKIAELCKEYGILMVYDAAHVPGLIAGGMFRD